MTPLEIAMARRDVALLKGDKGEVELIEIDLLIAKLAKELRFELMQDLLDRLETLAAGLEHDLAAVS